MRGNGGDLRRHVRVPTPFTAVLLERESPRALHLVNMSVTGALICGLAEVEIGEQVRLVLSLSSSGAVALAARVVRKPSLVEDSNEFAVVFTQLENGTQELLRDAVSWELSKRLRELRPEVVIVDRSSMVRQPIRQALVEFGVRNIQEVTSPLEAILCLAKRPRASVTSFVGSPVGSCNSLELAVFLAQDYPNVRVVALVGVREGNLDYPFGTRRSVGVEVLAQPWTSLHVASLMLDRRTARGARSAS
ncbi:MAG: hypothetical protein A2341_26375 [Deltaproteobacteria bacterium RIFOXYB12_FULL_58_9]|nr:MAG: hypothetical protein A2341_26375 [Deltaproteobacteria bacterium RIFOXYB12_FULL_58_9]